MPTTHGSQDVHVPSFNAAVDSVASDSIEGATGHVVIIEGEGETTERAVAVWHLSPTGRPTGAWIAPVSMLSEDVEAAEKLLRMTARRAVFAWDLQAPQRVVDHLTMWAKYPGTLRPPSVALPAVLDEIGWHRSIYASALDELRRTDKSKAAPLVWSRDIPAAASWQELVEAASLRRPMAPSPVASDALHLARAAAWAAELWYQTETVRCRRRHLVDRFGPASMLPAGWVNQLRAAHHIGG